VRLINGFLIALCPCHTCEVFFHRNPIKKHEGLPPIAGCSLSKLQEIDAEKGAAGR
jgi:hypothetical protein